MKVTCAALVDEVAGAKGWFATHAFFERNGRDGIHAEVRLYERTIATLVHGPRSAKGEFASRSLRDLPELRAQLRRIDRLCDGVDDVIALPHRGARLVRVDSAKVRAAIRWMQRQSAWFWKHVRVERRWPVVIESRTWEANAWCYVMLDEDVPPLDVGLMLSCGNRRASAREYDGALLTLRAAFAARRYEVVDAREHHVVFATQSLSTVAALRRERAHLDACVREMRSR